MKIVVICIIFLLLIFTSACNKKDQNISIIEEKELDLQMIDAYEAGLFELDRICILSDATGKGVGRKLVDKLIDNASKWYDNESEKIRKLYLLTHEDNKNAHSFYEKVGFSHETTLKDHYYKDQDERVYVMFF